jgi:hypothetical protein
LSHRRRAPRDRWHEPVSTRSARLIIYNSPIMAIAGLGPTRTPVPRMRAPPESAPDAAGIPCSLIPSQFPPGAPHRAFFARRHEGRKRRGFPLLFHSRTYYRDIACSLSDKASSPICVMARSARDDEPAQGDGAWPASGRRQPSRSVPPTAPDPRSGAVFLSIPAQAGSLFQTLRAPAEGK